MALTPVVVTISASGAQMAHKISATLGGLPVHGRRGRVQKADVFFDNALHHIRDLFLARVPVIGVCASGILIRAVGPHLCDKTSEPPVLSVADDGSIVVPLLGGHRGANRLARQLASALGSAAAVTTAGDVALGIALDAPPAGWRLANPHDAKGAMAALLSGGGADIQGRAPDWLADVPKGQEVRISCDSAPVPNLGPHHLHFAPQKMALGVGCARDCPPQELQNLVMQTLATQNISPFAIHSINTIDLKADEPAVLELAAHLNVPLRLFEAAQLEAQTPRLSAPSDVVYQEVGCHGVCEAAALAQAGADGRLLATKQKSKNATCALVQNDTPLLDLCGRARGRLAIVGIGPGQSSWRTAEASQMIASAQELVGYGLYIDLLGPLAHGKKRSDFPLGGEEARCRYALEQAAKGQNVALICSGDAGIYAMAALVFELLDRAPDQKGVSDAARRVEVLCAPGISALQGAAARAGAPLGHDFCTISLSDLLTPRDDILRRLHAAAQGDFVIAFYNPVSKTRRTLLAQARDILLAHRQANTPVLLARALGRKDENIIYRTLETLRVEDVDMLTLVLVGSSNSKVTWLGDGPRMFTPRGYARKIDGDLAGQTTQAKDETS